MESGGSRNYFRAAIRRTEIHSVVVKQSPPLSPEGFEGWQEDGEGTEGGHTRERTLSRHAVSGVIDPILRSPDLCPLHARQQAGQPPFLPSGKRRDRVSTRETLSHRYYDFLLTPQFSVFYLLPLH